MKFKLSFSLLIVVGLFVSCKKGELPVPLPDKGDILTAQAVLSPTYENQVYFNLSTGESVGTSHRSDWDLGFSCTQTPYIILNTAKVMLASRVDGKTFNEITDISTIEENQETDRGSGNIDSLAIKGGSIFLIDRGRDNGVHQGYFKLEISEHTPQFFKGRVANIDGSNEQTITINKDNAYNFAFLKWHDTEAITTPLVEPKKDTWDLVFTQFVHVFYEPSFMRYSVVGCLTNPYQTKSLLVKEQSFNEINIVSAQNLTLSTDRDEIGHDWKQFVFTPAPGVFLVDNTKNYVIETQEGLFYKLRFVDFYDPSTGEKGTAVFEYVPL